METGFHKILLLFFAAYLIIGSASEVVEKRLLRLEGDITRLWQENEQLRGDVSRLSEQNTELKNDLTALRGDVEARVMNVVAFSAYHNEGYADYGSGVKINFPNVITNLGGGYDSTVSTFTCPVTGTYHFSVHADCLHDHRFLAGIYKGGALVATANGHSHSHRQSSMGVVVECSLGEQVEVRSVEVTSRIYNYNNYRTTVFTGFLISI